MNFIFVLTRGFQNCMARARGDFFRAMEVYTNQAWLASLRVVANRAFLFYQPKSLTFEEPN
jgi:hypothetical protein